MLVAIAIGSVLVEMALVAHVPQGITFDPAPQLLAVKQYLAGHSPSPNHFVTVNPQDLSQDWVQWISVRPPGTQLFAWPLLAIGLDVGSSVRIMADICLLVGSVGWALWLGLFRLPSSLAMPTVFLLPWIHYANSNLIQYQPEILLFALAPWLLLGGWRLVNHSGTSRNRRILAGTLGFGCGLAYIFKSTGALLVAGILGFITLVVLVQLLSRASWFSEWFPQLCPAEERPVQSAGVGMTASSRHSLFPFLLLTILTTLPLFLAWSVVNFRYSNHISTFDEYMAVREVAWPLIVNMLGFPALAIGDGGGLWHYLLLNQSHGIFYNHPYGQEIVGMLGIPGGVFMYLLPFWSSAWRGPGKLGITLFVTTMTGLAVVWTHANIGYEIRYITVSALALMPVLLREGLRIWHSSTNRRVTRIVLILGGFFYLWGPLTYGVVSFVAKINRPVAHYQPGVSGTFNPLLASTRSPRDIVQEVVGRFDPTRDIWFLSSVNIMLDLPGRALVATDWDTPEDLRQNRYATSRPIRVLALIAKANETNGKGRIMRDSFVGSTGWEHVPLEGSPNDLWLTSVQPVQR
ncbi:MAG: hypothetical protein HQL64_11245 [Magnetococcales bacterium]|nr:hypothetical protein [Magnetococcales bacterium]